MKKDFALGALVTAVVLAAAFSALQTNSIVSANKEVWTSAVCVYVNNEQVGPCTHNLVTNQGLNWTRDKLSGVSSASGSATSLALGNTTSAEVAALTSLPGQINDCGLTPVAGTASTVGSSVGNYSVTYLWVSSCNSETVNTTALYNQSAPGTSCGSNCTMFAGKNFAAPVTLQSGDQLNVTWYVWAVTG